MERKTGATMTKGLATAKFNGRGNARNKGIRLTLLLLALTSLVILAAMVSVANNNSQLYSFLIGIGLLLFVIANAVAVRQVLQQLAKLRIQAVNDRKKLLALEQTLAKVDGGFDVVELAFAGLDGEISEIKKETISLRALAKNASNNSTDSDTGKLENSIPRALDSTFENRDDEILLIGGTASIDAALKWQLRSKAQLETINYRLAPRKILDIARYSSVVISLDDLEDELPKIVPFAWIAQHANLIVIAGATDQIDSLKKLSAGTPVDFVVIKEESFGCRLSVVRNLEGTQK